MNNYEGKRILITGYMGYIGSRLFKALVNLHKAKEVYLLDLKDGSDALYANLPDVDYVFHLSAQTGAVPSIKNPINDARQNILVTIRLAEFYKNKAKIIFTTSGAAKSPESPYGLSKKTAEEYIKLLHNDYVILRFSSIYGDKDRGVVDTFIRDKTCFIYGDGLATRDFVHVNDIVNCLIKSVGWENGEYECGSGIPTTVQEIADATGKEVKHLPKREGEKDFAVLTNTTPDWEPLENVINYVMRKCKR